MKNWSVMLYAVLLASCGSNSAPPAKVVDAAQLPASAVEAMCSKLHAEGMSSEVRVVSETQAIVSPNTLQGLARSSFETRKPRADAIQAIVATPLMPVEPPAKPCMQLVTAAEAAKISDMMVIQFSSPFMNPWGREVGALARMSLGGESSTWYWVPLLNQNGHWLAATPRLLSVIE